MLRVMDDHVLHKTFLVFELLGTVGTGKRLLILVGPEVEGQMSQFLESLSTELTPVRLLGSFGSLLLFWGTEVVLKDVGSVEGEVTGAADLGLHELVLCQNMIFQHPRVEEGLVADVTLCPLLIHVGLHVLDQATLKLEYPVTFQTLVIVLPCLRRSSSDPLPRGTVQGECNSFPNATTVDKSSTARCAPGGTRFALCLRFSIVFITPIINIVNIVAYNNE